MDLLKDTIMIIGIPQDYHATLVRWASERNGTPVRSLGARTTAAGI